MLKIYRMEPGGGFYVTQHRDLKIESELNNYEKKLYFSYPAGLYRIFCEDYVEAQGEEYVVKELSPTRDGYKEAVALLNLEELEGRLFKEFTKEAAPAGDCLADALEGTGWAYDCSVSDTILRNISLKKTSAKKVIDKLCMAYGCEAEYSARNKRVTLKEKIGSDRGVFLLKGANLLKTEVQRDTYDYCTRIIPIGKDGLEVTEVNGGRNYVEEAGAPKVIPTYWEDTSYDDPQSLLEAAKRKLEEASKPGTSIRASVADLAKINPDKFGAAYSFGLGDLVRIIETEDDATDEYRIVKTVEHPDQPYKNEVEFANKMPSFEEMQKRLLAAAECIGKVTDGESIVIGSNIDGLKASQIRGLESYSTEPITNIEIESMFK